MTPLQLARRAMNQPQLPYDERGERALARVLIIDPRERVGTAISRQFEQTDAAELLTSVPDRDSGDVARLFSNRDLLVFSPLSVRRGHLLPDPELAECVFQAARAAGVAGLVLLSSAEIYGADYSNPGTI